MFGRNRKLLWANLILGICSLFVFVFCTLAWYQVDSQAPETTIQTTDPHLAIDNTNVTGYKVVPTIGTDGFADHTSNTVTAKKGESYDTSNNHQASEDSNFDVPADGLGYYLVKKNPGDTYKYKYDGAAYSWKLAELENSGVNYECLSSRSVTTSDRFIIRQYSYNTSTYSTVNAKVAIEKDSGSFTIDSTTYEIAPTAAGTYNIWFDSATKKVTFETVESAASLNHKGRAMKKEPSRAIAASGSITVYYAISTTYTVKANANTGDGWPGAVTMTKQSYLYNDTPVYSATINYTNSTFWELQFQLYDGDTWKSQQLGLNNTSTSAASIDKKIWWNGSGTTRDSFYDSTFGLLYDGWIMSGKSGTGSTTFGNPATYDFAISQSKRLNSSAGNLGQITVTLNPGDVFKIAYLKKGAQGEWAGADKLELYYNGSSTTDIAYVGLYFANMTTDANCAVKTDISSFSCTIYYTTSKKINVNPSSSVVIKASKFNFGGTFEEVASTNVYSYDTTFGTSVSISTLNGLSGSFTIPSNYSRVGTAYYSNTNCTTSVGSSFLADANPKIIYIKVQENAITITLKAFFVNKSTDTSGNIDNARAKTLSAQYGANTTVTAASLKTHWNGSGVGTAYSDSLTYGGIAYTYSRIDNATHNGAFVNGTVANETTLYVRYVRDRHTITFAPSFFLSEDDGGAQLEVSLSNVKYLNDRSDVVTKTQTVLDGNSLSSETFNNCYWQDHANGIWYVFSREGSTWYRNEACTESYSGAVTASNPNPKTLYAKMVAYPLTTFYIDADNPGWNDVYLHIWGTLINLNDGMNHSLTAKAVTTVSGNKLFKVSIPTYNVSGFLIHNGVTSGDGNKTSDVTISNLTSSASKYLYIGTGSPHAASFVEYKSTSATNVWVRQWNGSAWANVANGQLLRGDGTGNDFILESGLKLESGAIVQVYDYGASTAYGYSEYVEANKVEHPYVATGKGGAGITLSHFSGTARFNFYITHAGKLSVAMVPDYGNGYYIVPYNTSIYSSTPTKYTDHYCGAIKMDSNDYSAIYTGYYTAGGAGNRIFIKSYLDAVDTLANVLTGSSSSYATMTDGVITFNAAGRYTIQVTNRTVDITEYNVGDFFKLNPLNPASASTSSAIWAQKTSLVIEVPFTCTNPYNSAMTLTTDCSASYIGVGLYVTNSRLGSGDPYTIYSALRGEVSASSFYNSLSRANSGVPISDFNNCPVTANSPATFYAYILIDYYPGVTSSQLLETPGSFKLYLRSNQP